MGFLSYWIFSLITLLGATAINAEEPKPSFGKTAMDAYIYGYPLVLMDVTEEVMTSTPTLTASKAPVNQLLNMRAFPSPEMHDVVSPNADTLYTSGWIDVSKEPMILTLPNMGDRYFLFPLLDQWTNVFFSPGTRTTGQQAINLAITGPDWKGTLPEGLKEVKAPTSNVWLIGRIESAGPSDYAAVNKLQDQVKLIPLSAWGKEYIPPKDVQVKSNVDLSTAPVEQLIKMDGVTFFKRLSQLLKTTPIPASDTEYVKQFESIGLVPGKDFDGNLSPEQIEALNIASKDAMKEIIKNWEGQSLMTKVNGWGMILKDIGSYGNHYDIRATVAYGGLGANLPQDAIYPFIRTDSKGELLNGASKYVVHFDKGQIPPVKGFWSITMYDNHQFFVPNPINRYAIGNRNQLKFNPDGSLDIYIQNESPGADKESNWLPAPKDGFNLILRLYYPEQAILNGEWKPPLVERVG